MSRSFNPTIPRPVPEKLGGEQSPDTVLALDMFSASQKLFDRSGLLNHAAATGTTPALGPTGPVRYFDGVDDRLLLDDAPSLDMGTGQDFTLDWFGNPDSTLVLTANTNRYQLAAKYTSTTGYSLFLAGGAAGNCGGIQIVVGNGDRYLAWSSTTDIRSLLTDGTWKSIIVVFDRDTNAPSLYINGVAYGLTSNANGRGACQFTAACKDYLTVDDNAAISATTVLYGVVDVMLDSVGANRPLVVKGTDLTVAANLEFGLYYSHVGTNFKFSVSDGITITTVTDTGAAPSLATWYHIEFGLTVDGVLFIARNNGADITSAACPAIQDAENALVLGADLTNGTFHNGRLANLGLSKTIPATAARTALYNAGNSRTYLELTAANGLDTYAAALAAHWNLDEAESGYTNPQRLDSVGTSHLTPSAVALISPTVLNGGFETAGGGGADVFANWTESVAGTSTVNDDAIAPYAGTHCCRMDIDASGSIAQVYQSAILVSGKKYNLSVYAKVDSTTGAPQIGTDSITAANTVIATLTTSYQEYTLSGVAISSTFIIKRIGSASRSLYLDQVTLTSIGPLAATGPSTTQYLLQFAANDLSNAAGLYIGCLDASSRWFKGLMGEIQIAKRALSAAEAQAEFRRNAWKYGVKS